MRKGATYMNIENNNEELNGQMSLFENEPTEQTEAENDGFKDAVEETLSKIRHQSLLLGFQVACKEILDKIMTFENIHGSKTNNDHKRLIKHIKTFCVIGLSGEISTNNQTVQN